MNQIGVALENTVIAVGNVSGDLLQNTGSVHVLTERGLSEHLITT